MTAELIPLLIIALISIMLLILAITILLGKGDSLIAGYNTATKTERETYNMRRVRICIGGMLLVLPLLMFLFANNFIVIIAAAIPLAILSIILANTWAKK